MDVYIKDKDIKNDQIRNLEKETLHLRKYFINSLSVLKLIC
jgi:hypothetical protein